MRRRPVALIRFIVHPRTWYVLCWLVAVGLTGLHYYVARHIYDSPRTGEPTTDRRDENYGHTHVDYGNQWLIARLVATGRGREMYLRSAQWQVLEAAFPRADEAPAAKDHDADSLLGWVMKVPPDEPG